MNKKVLVTGAGGFVGGALSAALLARGRKVVLATRKKGDLADARYCRSILRGVDTVYYLAGYKKNLRIHLAKPFLVASENVRPFLTFLKELRLSRVKKLIYLSSTIVEYFRDETPRDGYVLGKYLNELFLKAFHEESAIEIKVVRSALVYGPGDNFDPETANFLPAIITKVFASRKDVEVWGRGKRRLQFIYIEDLVNNLLAAERAKGDFFVFGDPHPASVNEIVRKIINLSGKRLGIKNNLREADKTTKLARFKNLVALRVPLEEGLKRTFAWKKF